MGPQDELAASLLDCFCRKGPDSFDRYLSLFRKKILIKTALKYVSPYAGDHSRFSNRCNAKALFILLF